MIDVRGDRRYETLAPRRRAGRRRSCAPRRACRTCRSSTRRAAPSCASRSIAPRAAEQGLSVAQVAMARAHGDGGRRGDARCARARTRSRSACACARATAPRPTTCALRDADDAARAGQARRRRALRARRGAAGDRARGSQPPDPDLGDAARPRARRHRHRHASRASKALKLPKDVTYAYDGQVRMMNENNEAIGLALLLGGRLHLHRAGVAVRELHPPAHDHADAAAGARRRHRRRSS